MNSGIDLRKIAVLAVDDADDNLDLLEEMLEDEVWSFIPAQSGEEAIRLATEHRPDIVLLDLMMPGMNGLSVLRAFRGIEVLRETPIIVLTAHADRDNALAAKRMHCDHILTKPLSRERLLAEMQKCWSERWNDVQHADCSSGKEPETAQDKQLGRTMQEAQRLLEANEVPEVIGPIQTIDCLRNLIPADSVIGQKLIKVANSPAYPARYPARNITEAIVRIGIRETKALVRKAAPAFQNHESSPRTVRALELLETMTRLFPDRTATKAGTLALLAELNSAVEPEVSTKTWGAQRPSSLLHDDHFCEEKTL